MKTSNPTFFITYADKINEIQQAITEYPIIKI